ncbi:chaperone atp11p [Thecamonas trahens ATCC 50062]|uniref:Chaperone atp11p n=1 Tax=Thecamonas trahens ATCC 50062 TaxID=461836 RepID=A0A0L0DIV3_THETB|nr:chaperone atp11p [Thecamonas trahens ATCC 50062]KNC52036.1 chaperone atp11p [Thecamonas trahens ATCC 50062]|eukprot:XP_013755618.1 chaperone atp11p [Thecamonas trahens ATCC 50062]
MEEEDAKGDTGEEKTAEMFRALARLPLAAVRSMGGAVRVASYSEAAADEAARKAASAASMVLPETLEGILDLDKVSEVPREDLVEGWRAHHLDKDGVVCATVGGEVGAKLASRVVESPRFVVPIPRDQGFVTVLLEGRRVEETQALDVWYTFLHTYQQYGGQAAPVMATRYYYDLAESKDLVLMRGGVDTMAISVEEAQYLGNQTSIFYLQDDKYTPFVHTFNHQPDSFNFEAILESLDLTLPTSG